MKELAIGVITVILSIISIPALMDGTLAFVLLPIGVVMIVDYFILGGRMWDELDI